MKSEDNILIKLHRQYSKDEVVLYLINTLRNLKIEKGKLSSNIEELEYHIRQKNNQIKHLEKKQKNNQNLHELRVLKEKIKKSNRENDYLRTQNKELRHKMLCQNQY